MSAQHLPVERRSKGSSIPSKQSTTFCAHEAPIRNMDSSVTPAECGTHQDIVEGEQSGGPQARARPRTRPIAAPAMTRRSRASHQRGFVPRCRRARCSPRRRFGFIAASSCRTPTIPVVSSVLGQLTERKVELRENRAPVRHRLRAGRADRFVARVGVVHGHLHVHSQAALHEKLPDAAETEGVSNLSSGEIDGGVLEADVPVALAGLAVGTAPRAWRATS